VLGGALFAGGPVGAAVGAATATFNGVLEHETGKDVGGHVLAWFGGEDADGPAPTVAEIYGLPWHESRELAAVEPVEAVPALSAGQWQMLTASLAEDTDVAAPPAPADVAAAMTRALDKYEALSRARALDHLAD
jgi:hypothetical protein